MTRLPRLVLGAALAVALTATARAAEPDKLIPAAADTVVVVNLKQIAGSDFGKKFLVEELKSAFAKGTTQFLTDIGLDPFQDVEKLLIASVETKFGGGKDDSANFLAVARGSFDSQKLFNRLEQETRTDPDKFSKVKEDGTTMFKYLPDAKASPVFVAVIDDKTVVAASDKKFVTEAVKAADAGKGAPIKKELAALIRKADDKASVYVASVTTGKLGDLGIPDQAGPIKLEGLNKALPKTESALITLRVATDVNLDVIMGMKDEEAANDMRNAFTDMIDQMKPLAKGIAGFAPELKSLPDMLDAIKVTSKNKDMILTVKLAGGDLGPIIGLQGKMAKKKDVKKN